MRKLPGFSTVVGLVGLVLVIGTVFVLLKARQYGEVATGFAARQMCACLYVQNRQEDECRAELGPELDRINLVYFEEKVIADFYGLDKAQATLRPGFGCSVTRFVGTTPYPGP